jgi:para-nitrobenzyl esterase
MVWIPGRGNIGGGSNRSFFNYDGEPFARQSVVSVTLNYRVDEFGFFSHPPLTSESLDHASGNQGILDQIAALKWLKDNLGKFRRRSGQRDHFRGVSRVRWVLAS